MIIKPTTPKIYLPRDPSCVLDLDARDVRGSKIYDRSGKGNHGAVTGAVLKPKNYGLPVLKFDGVDDKINCGNDASLDITDAITIEAWVNSPDVTKFYQMIQSKGNPQAYEMGFYDTDGKVGFGIRTSAGWVVAITGVLSNSTWYHLVGTYDKDGGTNNQKIYLNGVLVDQATQTGTINVNSANELEIGGREGSYDFNGSIDSVRIYNRTLLAEESSKNFNKLRHIYGI